MEKSLVPLKRQRIFFLIQKNRRQLAYILRYIGEGIVIILLMGYLFYNSVKLSLFFSPYVFFYVKNRLNDYKILEKERMAEIFKDGMQVVRSSMQAGYSFENSFKEAVKELEYLHGKGNDVYKGFLKITNMLSLNIPIEEGFLIFSQEMQIEEISNFSEILKYAKRTGGNLAEIIKNTSDIIAGKIELKKEIQTIISGKKYEGNIMSLIPAGIILYMRFSSFGTIEKLYGNTIGIIIMSICLGLYLLGVALVKKISRIVV